MTKASDGTEFAGTVTVSVLVDAGTQATGSVGAGACTSEGHGVFSYAPAQAETNGDNVMFTFYGTGAITSSVQFEPTVPTLDLVVEGALTLKEVLRVMLAENAGDLVYSGSATAPVYTFKSQDGTIDRIIATIDASGRNVTTANGA